MSEPVKSMQEAMRQNPHRRYNPLLDEWVLVSPHRTRRPWQGISDETYIEPQPHYDPDCYLCPGNQRANGMKTPQYESVYVFDNDFAALLPTTEQSGSSPDADKAAVGAPADAPNAESPAGRGLLVARPERGICRVICFTPRHDLSLPRMSSSAIRTVIDVWAEQYSELADLDFIRHVQIFENRGTMMGASNPHPHCQLWANESIPPLPARRLASQSIYLEQQGSLLLQDYLQLELGYEERIICANDGFVCLVPYWAVWPFETLVLPRFRISDLAAMSSRQRDQLADIVRRVGIRYDNLFRTHFPYSMGLHQAPVDGQPHTEWQFHIGYYPPLLRSATVRKHMVGYELCAMPQRDITPEQAAERLRAQSEEHFLEDEQ